MQEKRVVVTLRYTGGLNLRPYFLTTASLIKKSHPDCLIEKIILTPKPGGEKTFELLVDEKLVIGRSRCRDLGGGKMSVYLNWGDIDAAMIKARRKRRPSTGYNAEKMS
ncbi:hypothetical protein TL16_g02508 [Triparma laevis f. inornata]|uniref:Uncharacterized protein n=2 Tax=Triparma laevis TaxID=1534972 RepID=A0A9W7C3B9_9STRA|nr:hypothetical protein TL16_g02508 [Triparma laevis f. inornata]GMI02492.1 hypothetical protein TrLO_g53 [Triparma laevis f. longispina]